MADISGVPARRSKHRIPRTESKMQYVLGVLRSFGKRIFPKLKRLAEACGLTVATLRRILDELRRDGWLRTERRGPTSSLYILQVPKMAHSLAHSLAHSNSASLVSEVDVRGAEPSIERKPPQRQTLPAVMLRALEMMS